MISRKYTKVIEFWQTQEVADTYGGYTISEQIITKSWCNIKTVSSSSKTSQTLTDLGINDPYNSIIISLRYRNDITYNAINQFIKYRGEKYVIQNAPTNINLENTEVEIIAVKQSTESVVVYNIIGNSTFGATFDVTFN